MQKFKKVISLMLSLLIVFPVLLGMTVPVMAADPDKTIVSIYPVTGYLISEFNDGDALKPTDTVFKAVYSDGTESDVRGDNVKLSYIPVTLTADPNSLQQNVTAIYTHSEDNAVSCKFNVNVKGISAAVKTPPEQLEYDYNAQFNPSGLVITISNNYSTNPLEQTKDVAYNDDTDAFSFNTQKISIAGEQLIKGTYTDEYGMSADFYISVDCITLDRIEITDFGSLSMYWVNEDTFKPTYVHFKAYYTDGTISEYKELGISGGISWTPVDLTETGYQYVKISYTDRGKTVTAPQSYPINVVGLDRIAIESEPDKTEYAYGETFDPTGLTIGKYYTEGYYDVYGDDTYPNPSNNNKHKHNHNIGSGFVCSPTTFDKLGLHEITVKYTEHGRTVTATQTVTVTVSDGPTTLEIINGPTVTNYKIGDTINTSGLKLKVTRFSGSTSTIENPDEYEIDTVRATTLGTQKVTVSYTENGKTVSTSFNINVTNPATMIELSESNVRTLYREGEQISTSGISFDVTYYNGVTDTVDSGFTTYVSYNNWDSTGAHRTATVTVKYSKDGINAQKTYNIDIYKSVGEISTGGPYSVFYKGSVSITPSISRNVGTVSYGYRVSDESIATVSGGIIYGKNKGATDLTVTATETITKDGQSISFEYAQRTKINVRLTNLQWLIKFFLLFGWLGFDIGF